MFPLMIVPGIFGVYAVFHGFKFTLYHYLAVGAGGLEPPRDNSQQILSLVRLPIPPRSLKIRHVFFNTVISLKIQFYHILVNPAIFTFKVFDKFIP